MTSDPTAPHYQLAVFRDGDPISVQVLEDPFHTTVVTVGISRWDLFKALFKRQFSTQIKVKLHAPMNVIRAVMAVEVQSEDPQQEVFSDAGGKAQDARS